MMTSAREEQVLPDFAAVQDLIESGLGPEEREQLALGVAAHLILECTSDEIIAAVGSLDQLYSRSATRAKPFGFSEVDVFTRAGLRALKEVDGQHDVSQKRLHLLKTRRIAGSGIAGKPPQLTMELGGIEL